MKKGISNLILFLVLSICGYLLIANILHINYLNKYEVYNFSNDKIKTINLKIANYEDKLIKLNKLNSKVIKEKDLNTIKTNANETIQVIKSNPLLKYVDENKFYLKDLFELDMVTKTTTLSTISTINILTEYDSSLKAYLEFYKTDLLDSMIGKQDRFLRGYDAYKYQTTRLTSGNYADVKDYGILSRVTSLENDITKANYIIDLVLKVGGNKNA